MNSVRKSGTHSQSSEFQRAWEALILQPGQLSPSPRHLQVLGDSTTLQSGCFFTRPLLASQSHPQLFSIALWNLAALMLPQTHRKCSRMARISSQPLDHSSVCAILKKNSPEDFTLMLISQCLLTSIKHSSFKGHFSDSLLNHDCFFSSTWAETPDLNKSMVQMVLIESLRDSDFPLNLHQVSSMCIALSIIIHVPTEQAIAC